MCCWPCQDPRAHCHLPKHREGQVCAQAASIAPKPAELTLGIPDSMQVGTSHPRDLGSPAPFRLEPQAGRGWRSESTTNGQYKPLVGSLDRSGEPAVIPAFPHPFQVQVQAGCPPAPSPGPHSPDSMLLQVIFSNPDDSKILLLPLAAREAAAASELPSPSSKLLFVKQR